MKEMRPLAKQVYRGRKLQRISWARPQGGHEKEAARSPREWQGQGREEGRVQVRMARTVSELSEPGFFESFTYARQQCGPY